MAKQPIIKGAGSTSVSQPSAMGSRFVSYDPKRADAESQTPAILREVSGLAANLRQIERRLEKAISRKAMDKVLTLSALLLKQRAKASLLGAQLENMGRANPFDLRPAVAPEPRAGVRKAYDPRHMDKFGRPRKQARFSEPNPSDPFEDVPMTNALRITGVIQVIGRRPRDNAKLARLVNSVAEAAKVEAEFIRKGYSDVVRRNLSEPLVPRAAGKVVVKKKGN